MRAAIGSWMLGLAALSMSIGAGGCSTTPGKQDMATAQPDLSTAAAPMLTVNNTISWCTVTVTVGSGAPTTFGDASHVFTAAAGTTVMLSATPKPTFMPVKWTGTTTMNGASATYVMTGAPAQTVTACCPLMDGSGC